MSWKPEHLKPGAVGVSASRRTDIPALFGRWFERRLEAGFADYVPAGPPRHVRRSLLEEDVTHFCFWTKWPRPFFRVLEKVLRRGYPVLWNITVSGLGGTEVEPHVPEARRVIEAIRELSTIVRPSAILWRYDPLLVTDRFTNAHHLETFARIADRLAGHVDRVATSFVYPYKRQVEPDLRAYERESGDSRAELARADRVGLAEALRSIAEKAGIPFTLCCSPEIRESVGCPRTGCNSWSWATRAYPELRRHRALRDRPTRDDCGCSEEIDIGVYDTCVLGCRYCYASRNEGAARANLVRHDPGQACILPLIRNRGS